MTTKIINRIEKKIDQIEKMHDKESMLCEEVKDLLAELKENQDNFTDLEWRSLYKLSENTFVEESDSLKLGAAGAGLTDND